MTCRIVRSIVVLVWIAAAVAACGRQASEPDNRTLESVATPSGEASGAPESPSLGGRVWAVETVNGEALPLPENARVPTIQFDESAQSAHGFAGCNTFNGAYRSTGESIKLGPFAVTRRACGALDAVERTFLGALAQAQRYTVNKDSLELLAADGSVLARFKPRGY